MPALVSCAQSQNVMPALGNRSEIGIIAEPMIPNACSMPCNCSTFTNASSVVILIYVILQLILLLSCGDRAVARDHCWARAQRVATGVIAGVVIAGSCLRRMAI